MKRKKKTRTYKVTETENGAMKRFLVQRLALSIEMGRVQEGIGDLWKVVGEKYGFDREKRGYTWDNEKGIVEELGSSEEKK